MKKSIERAVWEVTEVGFMGVDEVTRGGSGAPGRAPSEDEDWRAAGLCSQSDPDLWFAVGAMEHKAAKSICRKCPVRTQCLAYAMEAPVDHGIWGGLTERERRRARRQAGTGWRAVLT